MKLPNAAVYDVLETLVIDIMKTLDGIPEDDLNYWKPTAETQGGGEMNTFAGVCLHVVEAARWMFLHQTLGLEVIRDRESRFTANATRAEIETGFQDLLAEVRDHLDQLDKTDLSQPAPAFRENHPGWIRAHWLLHMLEHTGLHLGHLQIHRQLWLAAQTPR